MPFKQGFAFRIRGSTLPSSDFPSTPCPIFFQIGGLAVGLHIRFAEVSRGGVRLVFSVGTAAHETNRRSLLDEAYKLAFTQQFKNKDISEGGSKGIILLNKTQTLAEAKRQAPLAFKAYIDNMLDLLLPHHDVDDGLGISEVWFLGPDENTGTGGLLDWAAQRAKERGSVWWKAFTTGKLIQHGGIPHDRFGMTTASVEAYVKGIYNKLGLKEEEMTRIQTGGPDGDLGCNALLQTKSKTIAVVDGSGVLYDPNGLDVGELHRLCSLRFEGKPTNAMLYDSSLLSPLGFKVDQEARDITLPDGVKVASGLEFRNFFHLSRYASADLFNPCGGRPASITPQNLDKLFDEVTGEKKFKFIVEGANVFITDDARRILEDRGVILFKDASTNKGGVTSSSLEVLAALALTEEEFNQHMQVKDPNNPPRFYKEYVKAILERIRENANLEFEAIWREAKRTGLRCCDLTDILSQKIIELKTDISKSNCLWADEGLVNYVLSSAVPDVLVPQLLSVEVFRKRVPEAYQQAIFTSFLSSRFFYGQPFTANVSAFAFIAYLEELKQKIQKQNPKP